MAQRRDLIPITVYLPPELIDRLRRQAAATHESMSNIVRRELMLPKVAGGDLARPVELERVRVSDPVPRHPT